MENRFLKRSVISLTVGSPVTVLQSTFVYPIAGVMYFKQVEGEEVQMWGRMYWVNGMGHTVDHNWHIHRLSVRLCQSDSLNAHVIKELIRSTLIN